MPSRPRIVFAVVLTIILLAGCNLPLGRQASQATTTQTQIRVVASKVPDTQIPVFPTKVPDTQVPVIPTTAPQTQASPTQDATQTSIAHMVSPADIKTEILPAGEYQQTAPAGFRNLLVYPVGGLEWASNDCENFTAAPAFLHAPIQIHALSHDIEENLFVVCGWQKNEPVSITLTRPDGSQEHSSQTYDGSMDLSYILPMDYGMQLGDYSLTFESSSGKVSHNFKVVWPAGPGLVATEAKKYFVYGFQPGEHVVAMAYQKSTDALRLSTWREMTMDERGELLLDDRFTDDLLAVVGDASGPAWNNWLLGVFIDKNMYYIQVGPCSGAPASRLQSFSFAYVTNGDPNNVRSSPSKSAALIGKIKAGTVLVVQRNAPVCADGLLWWKIVERDEKGPSGWTAEGSGSDYWLAPLQ